VRFREKEASNKRGGALLRKYREKKKKTLQARCIEEKKGGKKRIQPYIAKEGRFASIRLRERRRGGGERTALEYDPDQIP